MPQEASNYLFAGPGIGLQYIGEHCYGYSGTINVTAETVTGLNFTTGSGYILGSFYYQLDTTNLTAGQEVGYSVAMNGEQIAIAKGGEPAGSGLNTVSTPYELSVIIPPFSLVVVSLISTDPEAIPMGITFTGRAYSA
tara:strand:- start:49 stop:462 length:414 start_codon:yes stop_codon:yes gene_type:complete